MSLFHALLLILVVCLALTIDLNRTARRGGIPRHWWRP